MAAKDLVINLLAKDKASAELKKVGNSMSALERQSKSLHRAGQMIGAGAIIAFGAASVKAYAEAEKSQVKLEEAYRKFPAVASVSISAMRDLNAAIQAKTGTDDDELAAAEAKLAMYNLTGEQIKQLIPIVNDYAVANGIGVTEAAGKVGKAMLGNAKALKDIGINFKATGDKTKDFATIFDALQSKVGGAGDAFGKTPAGQLAILNKSMDDLKEEIGAQLMPALSSLIGIVKPIVGTFAKLPEPLQTVALGIGAVAAATLILGPRVFDVVRGFKDLIPESYKAAAALEAEAAAATQAGTATTAAGTGVKGLAAGLAGALSVAASAAAVIMGLGKAASLAEQAFGRGAQSAESFGASFNDGMTAEQMLKVKEAMAQVAGQSGILGVAVRGASGDLIGATKDFFNAGDEIKNFDTSLAKLVSDGNAQQAAGYLSAMGVSADEARAKLPQYAAALDASAASADAAGGSVAGLSDNLNAASRDTADFAENTLKAITQADGLKFAADQLKASLDALGGKAISTDTATANLYASFDSAKKSITDATKDTNAQTDAVIKGGKALDLQTEAGRTAQSSLADIAKSADDLTSSYKEAGRSTEDVTAMQEKAREAFLQAAKKAGLGKDAAKALADQYGLMPDKVESKIVASGIDDAAQAVLSYKLSLLDIPPERRTQIITEWKTEGSKPQRPPIVAVPGGRGQGAGAATGGYIRGAGTGTSDSIPAMLSDGEYVINAASVSRLGVPFLHSLNRFADGGPVTTSGVAALTPAQLLAKFVRDTATAIRLEQGLLKLRQDMAAQSRDTKNSVKSFASLTNSFDTKAYKTAQADVVTARAALNSAATPAERTAALANLDQAQAAARTSKPTAGNVIAGLKAKLNVIKSFGANVRKLARMGIPRSFLQQIIDAGPEEGGELAKALLDSSPADMKELRALALSVDRESGRIGNQRAHLEYDPLISRQRGLVNSAVARAGVDRETLTTQVVVKLDGKEIATALAAYKRSVGGRKLGLD
jgi:hypothetical protein